jgi:hypothetical protein
MSDNEATRARFARAWAAAVERALPPFNVERGAVRLLEALNQRKRKPALSLRVVLVAAAIAAIVLAVASFRSVFTQGGLELTVDGKEATSADRLGDAEPHLVRFSDGSTISLARESSLEVSEVNAHRVGIKMRHGTASFDVVHSDQNVWVIGAGPFQVRVLGTAFRVEWHADAQRFSVGVTRGAVRVSGPLLGSERVISAGVTCTVDLVAHQAAFGTDATGVERPETAANEQEAPSNPDAEARPTPKLEHGPSPVPPAPSGHVDVGRQAALDWRELERRGQFDKAVQEALRTGVDHIYGAASAEDLMGLARAARLAGRLDVSKAALLSCRRRFAGTRDAAMAAYLLGRSAASADAARWFSTYLTEQPDGPLAREASGRLMEAQFGSGQREAARAQARTYLLRYPAGPHADFANMVLRQ